MPKGLTTRPLAGDLPPPRGQCQAYVKGHDRRERRCPNQAKFGQRYCGRHRHWNLSRQAWDDSKQRRIL